MQITEIEKEHHLYPTKLKRIKDPPKKLYVVGNLEILQRELVIAMVGSRKCSRYGQMQAFRFAREIAKEGITVVSGMAIGIDAVSHLAAMRQKGNTIAVLGSGFEHIFPEENEYLFYQILKEGGCIISEYAPNEPKSSSHFPKRNRIISGIASKVLVVEASKRSGSLITARLSMQEGKEVFAIPSDLDKKGGEGSNELILKGASFVTKPEQIISKLLEKSEKLAENRKREKRIIPAPYQSVYELLEKGEKYINDISKILKIPLPELSQIIMMMELEGYIEKLEGNQFRIRR